VRPGEEPGSGRPEGRPGDKIVGGAAANQPGDIPADIIDMGVEPESQQRPVPWRILGLIAALIVGGVVGYFVGDNHGRTTTRPSAAPSPTTIVKPFAAVALTGRQCSVQIGSRLQLGVEVTNNLTEPIMLTGIQIGLPLGGLRVRTKAFGTCGSVGGNTGPQPLAAGNSTWMSATFDVDEPCPGALPVLFVAVYDSGQTVVGGFADLGQVPYTGCNSSGG
jgi:hypothetical protein